MAGPAVAGAFAGQVLPPVVVAGFGLIAVVTALAPHTAAVMVAAAVVTALAVRAVG